MQFLFLALLSLNGAVNAQKVWVGCTEKQAKTGICYGGKQKPDPNFKCQKVIYAGSQGQAINDTVSSPQKYQCLPVGYHNSSQIFNPDTDTASKYLGLFRIWSSIGDNCSPGVGADSGCGSGLQCINYNKNAYSNPDYPLWKSKCVPQFIYYGNNNVPTTASRFQTCGEDTAQNLSCSVLRGSNKLTCKYTSAIVLGISDGHKWVCLTNSDSGNGWFSGPPRAVTNGMRFGTSGLI